MPRKLACGRFAHIFPQSYLLTLFVLILEKDDCSHFCGAPVFHSLFLQLPFLLLLNSSRDEFIYMQYLGKKIKSDSNNYTYMKGFPDSSNSKESACNVWDPGLIPELKGYVGEVQSTPLFFPGEFRGQKSMMGFSPWGHKELGTSEQLTHIYIHWYIMCHMTGSQWYTYTQVYSSIYTCIWLNPQNK